MRIVSRPPVSREPLVSRLRTNLEDAGCAIVTSAEGTSGVGRTTLIAEYTRRFARTYHGGIVRLRCHAEMPLRVGLAEVVTGLKMPERFVRSPNDPIHGVTRWMQHNDDWLVILEDVANWEMVSRLVETRERGHLIAVPADAVPEKLIVSEPIAVPSLTQEQSVALLQRGLLHPDASASSDVQDLAEALDRHPLGLVLAVGLLQGERTTPKAILEELQEETVCTDADNLLPETVSKLIGLAQRSVEACCTESLSVLRACACLDSERIATGLLQRVLGGSYATDETGLQRILRVLHHRGLIQFESTRGQCSMHPSVQSELRRRASQDRSARSQLGDLRRGMLNAVTGADGHPPLPDELTRRHADALCSGLDLGSDSFDAERLLTRTASLCSDVGAMTRAISLSRAAVEQTIKLWGESDSRTVDVLVQTSQLHRRHQQYRQARRGYRQAMAILESRDHPAAAQRFDLLCRLTETDLAEGLTNRARNRVQRAEEAFAQIAQPTEEQRSWMESVRGAYLLAAGRIDDAIAPLEASLSRREAILAADDPLLLRTRTVLSRAYYAAGRLVDAECILQADLRIRMQADSVSESDVVVPANLLAELLLSQGRLNEAEPLFRRVHQTRRETLGKMHWLVGEAASRLAVVYATRGNYTEAMPLFREAISVFGVVYGERHPEVARVMNDLAEMLFAQGQHDQARRLLERALKIQERRLRATDPQISRTRNNLAAIYASRGAYEDAEQQYRRDLASRRECSPPDTTGIATVLNNLGDVWRAQGRYTQAEAMFRESLQMRRAVFGEDHPAVAQSLSNLGYVLLLRRELPEAEQCLRQSLAIRRQVLSASHPHLASTFTNLGEALLQQYMLEEATDCFARSEEIIVEQYGEDSSQFAAAMTNRARLELRRGSRARAELHLLKARKIQERRVSPGKPQRAKTLAALAACHVAEGKFELAESEWEQALEVYRQNPGADLLAMSDVQYELARRHMVSDRSESAERLLRECLSIREQVERPEHRDVAACLVELAKVRLQRDDLENAQRHLDRAKVILETVAESRVSDELDPSEAGPASSGPLRRPDSLLIDVFGALAEIACRRRDPARAADLWNKQKSLIETLHGSDSEQMPGVLSQLAGAYYLLERYDDAEPLIARSLELAEARFGVEHPETARHAQNLAGVYLLQQNYDRAEPLLKRAMDILERLHGPLHDDLAVAMDEYIEVLQNTGRVDEAAGYEERVDHIRGREAHVLDDLL